MFENVAIVRLEIIEKSWNILGMQWLSSIILLFGLHSSLASVHKSSANRKLYNSDSSFFTSLFCCIYSIELGTSRNRGKRLNGWVSFVIFSPPACIQLSSQRTNGKWFQLGQRICISRIPQSSFHVHLV